MAKQSIYKNVLVQLDAGHGSNTAGKRSPIWSDGTQLFEWQYNRDLVKLISLGLRKYGVKTFILVPEITDVPLPIRTKRSNALTAKQQSILVSVHGNAGGGTGVEVWTSKGQTRSDTLATLWFESAQRKMQSIWPLRKDVSDGDPDKEESFWMLTQTACPAILTENGFMDTESDCRKMMDPEVQQIIADVHVESILKYIKRI